MRHYLTRMYEVILERGGTAQPPVGAADLGQARGIIEDYAEALVGVRLREQSYDSGKPLKLRLALQAERRATMLDALPLRVLIALDVLDAFECVHTFLREGDLDLAARTVPLMEETKYLFHLSELYARLNQISNRVPPTEPAAG